MRKTILFFFLALINIAAQSYQITGKVFDGKNNEPLIGVNIIIHELKIGTSTDINGSFLFINLIPGEYSITFSYIGHKTVIKSIDLKNDLDILITMQDGTVNLSEVLVTGNPFATDTKNISQSTLSIANLDLQIRRNTTIAQTLNYQPGISMRSNGIATARPIIRGFSNNRVLILENGLRMGDLSNTSDDHGISSDGSSPEKLEVLRGPASLLYGSNALGGVVNIITESIPTYIPNGIDGDFNLSTSSVNDEYVGCGDLHFGINKFSFHGNFFKRKSENYSDGDEKIVENSNLSSTGYQFGFSFIPSFGLGGMSYSNFSTNYGIPYSHLSENQHSDDEGPINIAMDKNEFRFQIESNKIGSFLNSFSLKAGYQDYMHNEILKKSGEIESSFGLKSYSADLSFNHKPIVKNLKGVFGFWLSNQKYTVSGEEAFTPNANYYGIAGYVLEQLQFENFTFQFGGRFEINNVEMPQTEISKTIFPSEEKSYYSLCGSLGIVFNLSEQISFFTNIANAFRAPTIEELSSFAIHGATATFDIGNRKLLNEKNLGLDLGFRLSKDHHIVELSIYYNFMNDFIFRSPNGKYYNPEGQTKFNDLNGFPVFQYSQGNARLFGFELKAQYELTRTLSITTIMDYANGKQSDQYLPQIPPFRFSIEQRYAEDNYWFGSIWKLTAAQNKVAPFESESPGYGIVDFYAGTKFLTGSFIHIINLRADNLFNQKYRDHLSATKDFAFMPGRNIQLSYKFLF